jgi:type II secretory pathway pseudopilin PulG
VNQRRCDGEEGETLLEILVTITIMGIALVSVMYGVLTAVASATSHRAEATDESVLRSFAERIKDPDDTPYVNCAVTGTYSTSPTGFTSPSGYTVKILSVGYPTADTKHAEGGCGDQGVQQIKLQVQSPSGNRQATEQTVIVKRRVCLVSDNPCVSS